MRNFNFDKLSLEELESRVNCHLASRTLLTVNQVKNAQLFSAGSSRTDDKTLNFFFLKPLWPVCEDVLTFVFVPTNSALNSLQQVS